MAPPALRTICLTNRFLFQAKKVSFSCTADEYALPEKSFTVFTTTVDSRTIRFILEHEPDEWVLRIRPQTNFSNGSDSGTVRIMPLVSMEGVHTDEYMEEPCDEDPETV